MKANPTDIRYVDILVVEDSPTQAEQLRHLLQQRDYSVRVAANGHQGLAEIRRRKPTIVITDIVMPEMDGYALCRAIKGEPALKEVPVVVVTSLSSIQDIARALECGADNFIRKPYDPDALLARIDYILLNLELRKGKRVSIGLELYLEGKKHYITSEREQIIDLLISTCEEAVSMNQELQARQAEIIRSNQTMAGLYRIANELNKAIAPDQVCHMALETAMDLPKFEAAWIYLVDEADGDCRLAAAANPRGVPVLPMDDAGEATAIVEGQASIPLVSAQGRLGVMRVLATRGETFDDEDRIVLDTIANQVAVALERARLHQNLECLVAQRTAALQAEVVERRNAEAKVVSLNRIYAVLSGINMLIVRVRERGELYRETCRIAVELGDFGLAWIGEADLDAGRVQPVAWCGAEQCPALHGQAVHDFSAFHGPLIDRVLRERHPEICRDLVAPPGVPLGAEALACGLHAMCVLPLMAEQQVVALLFLYAPQPEVFDAGEMRLLEELAGDISFALDNIAKEERINYLAYYDGLTGLPNRDLLHDRLRQGVALAHRHGGTVAVICIDLDRFKVINDGLGHHIGDGVLKEVGRFLGGVLRPADTLGRAGADNFVMICADLAAPGDVMPIIEQLQAALRTPIHVGELTTQVTASIGASFFPRDAEDPLTLLAFAELAMDQAKEHGGNQHAFFTSDLDTRASERLRLQNRLGAAVEAGELVVYYQPQVNSMTGTICGMEALVRWQHPELGLVPPGMFIPLAEESGLIVPLGEWVLREACRQNRAWQDEGISDFPMSVNLSVVQFRDHELLAKVGRILDDTGLEPHCLELEITESQLMQNSEVLIGFLQKVREMGVKIAIDDFGSGYSSLNYLKRLPVDRLKVDYSFVRDIITDPASASICRAVIAIAHNLRLGVVAEGVETEAHARYLARHYCENLQGYFFGKPAPAEQTAALLRERKPLLRLTPEQSARRTLLVVDDEEFVRNSLRRALRADGYQILVASSPIEAFDLLGRHPVGVILSDQRMPDMTGTEFLRRVKDIYPDAIRMVLSGYTDLETVTASVNEGAVFKFLLKPWDNDKLREVVRDAFWHYELSQRMAVNWYTAGGAGERPNGHSL